MRRVTGNRPRRAAARRAVRLSWAVLAAALWAGGSPAATRWQGLESPGLRPLDAGSLAKESVTALALDGAGFLWAGTQNGIARWDGYRARFYRAEAGQPQGLSDNYIQTLHIDAAGRLWAGSNAGALARYDPGTDRFLRLPGGDLSHSGIQGIADDGSLGLWIATGTDGAFHLDASGRILAHLIPGKDLPLAPLRAVLRDATGKLWFGTTDGVVQFDPASATIVARNSLSFTGCPAPVGVAKLAAGPQAGQIVVGTVRCGAMVLDGGQARAIDDGPSHPLRSGIVQAIAATPDGGMWLGGNFGALVLGPGQGAGRLLRHDPANPAGLPADQVNAFIFDRQGGLLIGTDQGVMRTAAVPPVASTIFAHARDVDLTGSDAAGIAADARGRLWLNYFTGGVDVLDPERGSVTHLPRAPAAGGAGLPASAVAGTSVLAEDDAIWLGFETGIFRADPDTLAVSSVPMPPGGHFVPLSLGRAGGTLWAGGFGTGLIALQPATFVPQLRGPLSDQRVRVLCQAPDGALWAGTYYGLTRIDPRSGAVERILPNAADPAALPAPYAFTLLFDRKGRLWVGMQGGGIAVLDTPGAGAPRRFRRIGRAQGLGHDNVDMLLAGADGRIWASTDDGIAVIDPENFAVRMLHAADGAGLTGYWSASGAATPQGELVFAGVGGLTVVHPERLLPPDGPPSLLISEVLVGGHPVPPLPFNADLPPALRLPPEARHLDVTFGAAEYRAPERLRYGVMLRGFDRDWIETDASERRATYTNLPPGHYGLALRVQSASGTWSADRVLPIEVLPAWYQTLWFQLGSAAALLAAIAALVQLRTAWLRGQARELERQVRARTEELERLAMVDPLTGIANRRHFALRADIEIAEARRAGTSLGLLAIDLDRFKALNDTHGHAAGDAALVHAAHIIERMTHKGDLAARIGGEEFAVLLPRTAPVELTAIAERLRQAIAASPVIYDAPSSGPVRITLTASLGVAWLGEGEESIDAALARADAALYAAKANGRNRVETASF